MSSSCDQSLQGQELPHIANVHPNISNCSHVQICVFFSFNLCLLSVLPTAQTHQWLMQPSFTGTSIELTDQV